MTVGWRVTVVSRPKHVLTKFSARSCCKAETSELPLTGAMVTSPLIPLVDNHVNTASDSLIVETPASCDNSFALADTAPNKVFGEESGLHGLFGYDFCSHREPAAQ